MLRFNGRRESFTCLIHFKCCKRDIFKRRKVFSTLASIMHEFHFFLKKHDNAVCSLSSRVRFDIDLWYLKIHLATKYVFKLFQLCLKNHKRRINISQRTKLTVSFETPSQIHCKIFSFHWFLNRSRMLVSHLSQN